MKIYMPSKYLKHQDLDGNDWVVTISDVKMEKIKGKDGEMEEKWVVYFKETDKGMILNKTNFKIILGLLRSDEADDWKGKRITLFAKDDVEMGGELVSGLRVRGKLPL